MEHTGRGYKGKSIWAIPLLQILLILLGVLCIVSGLRALASQRGGACTIAVAEATCNGLGAGGAVDSRDLSFSWKLEAENGGENLRQTAYQIVVTDRRGETVLDTGAVKSGEQRNRLHTVEALEPSERYYYQIRVWDQQGVPSALSAKIPFLTGLLDQSGWTGSWIQPGSQANLDLYNDTAWLRRDISLEKVPELAVIHVAAAGFYELYVNGEKVHDTLMAPSRSRVEDYTRLRYNTYDITPYLKTGSNTLGLWLDAGWTRYAHVRNGGVSPVVMAQLVTHQGETGETFSTDGTWQCKKASISHIGGFQWGDHGGERVTDQADNRWATAADQTGWTPVAVKTLETTISHDYNTGDKVLREVAVKQITDKGNGACLIELEENYTGFVRIHFRGYESGDVVTLRISDRSNAVTAHGQVYQYVATGEDGVFENKFNFFAGKYITVEGLKTPLRTDDVTGLMVGNSFDETASFSCSDDVITKIYEADVNTYRANTVGGVTMDCPHRERLGYGEANISNTWGCGLYAFDTEAYYRQVFENWRDRQFEDGYLPHVQPNFDGGGGTTWSSSLTITLADYYEYTGNAAVVAENYDAVCKWSEFLLSHVENGILQKYSHPTSAWFLGDWAVFEGDDSAESDQTLFFNNCVAIYVLQKNADFASLLGKAEDAARYEAAADEMRSAVHQKYYNAARGIYFEGQQRYAAVALCADIMPAAEKPRILENFAACLDQKEYVDGGSAGTVFILRAAGEILRRPDLIYQWLERTTPPSYRYFIEKGENTWPEFWDIADHYGGSRIHTCYTGISGWYARYLVGIQPTKAGMQEVDLRPYFPEALTSQTSCNDLGYGDLKIQWVREGSAVSYHLEVPVNQTVHLYPPAGYSLAGGVDGLTLGSGSYDLTFLNGEGA